MTFHALRVGWGALSRYWQEALMVPVVWESFTKILQVLAAGAFSREVGARTFHFVLFQWLFQASELS